MPPVCFIWFDKVPPFDITTDLKPCFTSSLETSTVPLSTPPVYNSGSTCNMDPLWYFFWEDLSAILRMKKDFLKLHYNDHHLAYKQFSCKSNNNIFFLGGYKSDMNGSKTSFLNEFCQKNQINYTCFDYFGHGESSGELLEGTISVWLENVILMMEKIIKSPAIIIGSSMGGWLALLLAVKRPDLVKSVIGIAAAPDFTEKLVWHKLSESQKSQLEKSNVIYLGEEKTESVLPFTKNLLKDGRKHLLLDREINIKKPVTLIHGMKDVDVPYQYAFEIEERLSSNNVTIMLKNDGDHRMSREEDLDVLSSAINLHLKYTS